MANDMKKEIVKCVCGIWTKPRMFRIEGIEVRGSECPKCGEAYLNGEDSMKVSEYRRVKDAVMDAKISTSGNSDVLRLPIALIKALRLTKGKKVRITVRGPNEVVVTV
jgi:predicted  nucleic acid-binding Zn-ribbon protein